MPTEEVKPKIKRDITMARLLVIHNFRDDTKTRKQNSFIRSVLVLCSTKVMEIFLLANVKASTGDGWRPLYNLHRCHQPFCVPCHWSMFPSAQWSLLCGMGAVARQQVRLLPGVINSAQNSKVTTMSSTVYASPVCFLRNKKKIGKFVQALEVLTF